MIRYETAPEFMTDAELIAAWRALPETDDSGTSPEHDALAAELLKRGLDL